ncbi:MAG: T9SS type A sorting domain-containing protein [Bacteroidota bacterium]
MKAKNYFFTQLAITVAMCVFYTPSIKAQLTKFQKWQQPSYFTGFTMSVWDNNDMREVNQQDFDSLKAIGATLVAIQTQGSLDVESPYAPNIYWAEYPDTTFHIDRLDTMVSFARNAGLMYVIVVRDGPGRMDVSEDTGSTIWTNPAEQQLYGKMLKDMAQRYLPDTLFVGMALTVEPNPLGELWEPPIAVLDSALLANGIDLNALYTLWIDSVRTVDTELPLVVGGVHASHPEYFSLVSKQADDNIVYTTHLYNPANFSHEAMPYSVTYPDNYWSVRLDDIEYFDKTFMKDSLYKPVRDFQLTYNVPILVGEFGIRLPQNGGELYLNDIAEIACESGWHYAIWGFNNGPEFNYKDMDSIYGTNYWNTVKGLMNCGATGFEETTIDNNVSVYPNPSDDNVYIEIQQAMLLQKCVISIYNIHGQLMLQEPLQQTKTEINIANFSKGVYVVKVGNSENTIVKKLIKK